MADETCNRWGCGEEVKMEYTPNKLGGYEDDGHTIFSGEKVIEAARNSPLEPAVDLGEGIKKFKDGEPGAEWSIGKSIWGAFGGGVIGKLIGGGTKGAATGAVVGSLGTAGIDYAQQKHKESQQDTDKPSMYENVKETGDKHQQESDYKNHLDYDLRQEAYQREKDGYKPEYDLLKQQAKRNEYKPSEEANQAYQQRLIEINKQHFATPKEKEDAMAQAFGEWRDGKFEPNAGLDESILNKLVKLTDNGFDWLKEKFDWLPDEFKEWLGLNRTGKFHIYDPLVLDLDGDGIELLKADGWNGIQFDYNGDGIKSSTGWVKSDDGLLVWDRNGDGKINNGSELLGEDTFPQNKLITSNISNTSSGNNSNSSSGGGMSVSDAPFNAIPIIENDGFYALSQLDSNQDGVIDANDANFNQIKVWRDLNQDGISEDGELFGLNELAIQSINLNTGNTQNNTAGNSIGKSSTYIKEDGSNGKIADVNFTLDTVHSEYIEHITIGEDQMLLPYLHGVGKLRDLREAARSLIIV